MADRSNINFAQLSNSQLEQLKKTESTINSARPSDGEEVILLAYSKPDHS